MGLILLQYLKLLFITVKLIEWCNYSFFNFPIYVLDDKILWPNGITIDYQDNVLYWVEAYYDQIGSISLDGTNKQVTLLLHIISLAGVHISNCILFNGFTLDVLAWVYFKIQQQSRGVFYHHEKMEKL